MTVRGSTPADPLGPRAQRLDRGERGTEDPPREEPDERDDDRHGDEQPDPQLPLREVDIVDRDRGDDRHPAGTGAGLQGDGAQRAGHPGARARDVDGSTGQRRREFGGAEQGREPVGAERGRDDPPLAVDDLDELGPGHRQRLRHARLVDEGDDLGGGPPGVGVERALQGRGEDREQSQDADGERDEQAADGRHDQPGA